MDSLAFSFIASMAADNLELAAEHAESGDAALALHELNEVAEKLSQLKDLVAAHDVLPQISRGEIPIQQLKELVHQTGVEMFNGKDAFHSVPDPAAPLSMLPTQEPTHAPNPGTEKPLQLGSPQQGRRRKTRSA